MREIEVRELAGCDWPRRSELVEGLASRPLARLEPHVEKSITTINHSCENDHLLSLRCCTTLENANRQFVNPQ